MHPFGHIEYSCHNNLLHLFRSVPPRVDALRVTVSVTRDLDRIPFGYLSPPQWDLQHAVFLVPFFVP
jgi:hypothetical protein